MRSRFGSAIAAFLVAAFVMLMAAVGHAQSTRGEIETVVREYLATHPDEVGVILKDYLIQHPEVLQVVFLELMTKRSKAAPAAKADPERTAAIKTNAPALFASPHQVTLGNPHGDVTLVEFFDYNCGYCRRALADMLELMKSDANLKIVLKELPVLGPGSVEAARVGAALRLQDPDGSKYLAFHRSLLGGRGKANKETALAAAREAGADIARIETDMAGEEVAQALDESRKLAGTLGFNGTPSWVVGEQAVVGAIGMTALADRIKAARH